MDRIVADNSHGDAEEATVVDEEPDLISGLPDCVLGSIVSRLDTEEGARTAALSRRWRHVWRDAAPLNLDDPLSNVVDDDLRVQLIPAILAAHPGPARRVAFRSLPLRRHVLHYDAWFRLPLFDAIQELVLHFPYWVGCHGQELPSSALRFASLRVLDIHNCNFPPAAGNGNCSPAHWAFPRLTHLSLKEVGIAEDVLEKMVSNSPRIEAMVLDTNSGHRHPRLSPLPSLRYLLVSARCLQRSELQQVVLEGAPNLEKLLLEQEFYAPSLRIIGPTKLLNTLGYLGTVIPILHLGTSTFNGIVPVSLVEQFPRVKILALMMPEPNLNVVIGYLKCFPCLHKLHIKFGYSWLHLKGAEIYDKIAPIECLDRSLRTVVLRPYQGLVSHVEFANFFIERAMVLELMKFGDCGGWTSTTEWAQQQRMCLNIDNRASKSAQFCFARDLPPEFFMGQGFSQEVPF